MRAASEFTIETWDANGRAVGVATGTPLAGAFIVREVSGGAGEIVGRSEVLFAGAFSEERGSGTYVAIDAFEGTILGRRGTMSFWHANTMRRGRPVEGSSHLVIVPDSGTGELEGIAGTGIIRAEGERHELVLEIDFEDDPAAYDGEVVPEPRGEVEAAPAADGSAE